MEEVVAQFQRLNLHCFVVSLGSMLGKALLPSRLAKVHRLGFQGTRHARYAYKEQVTDAQ